MSPRPPQSESWLVRLWFPVALLLLLVLAIPSIVFFLMHVVDAQGDMNTWLQDNLDINYQLKLPAFWAFVLLLLPLLVVLLYFLKLKRRPLQVPSTFLWKKSIEDLHVNSLLQWLRRNVLLVLQLLILLTLIYAIMGFRIFAEAATGRHYIIMIDNSASMAATDVAGSRLEWAKGEAHKEIDAATDEDFGMVIVFNDKATTLQSYTNNRAKLREAVRGIQQTQRLTRIEEALRLADSLANPLRSTEDVASRPPGEEPGKERTYVQPRGTPTAVYLYSDGRFPDMNEEVLNNLNSRRASNANPLGNISLHFSSAGAAGADKVNNLGIVALNAVRYLDPTRPHDPEIVRLVALARVRNFRAAPANVKMRLDVYVDGKVQHLEQATLALPARTLTVVADKDEPVDKATEKSARKKETVKDEPGESAVEFKLPPLPLQANLVLHAYLQGVQDDFALDNEAWLAFAPQRKAKVLRIGPANPFLSAFFEQEATRKSAAVEAIAFEDLQKEEHRRALRSGAYDLVLFDRCAVANVTDLPEANTFSIATPPPPWERSKKVLKNPVIMVAARGHPVLSQLTTLWDIGVVEAYSFNSAANLRPDYRDKYALQPEQRELPLLPTCKTLLETGGKVPVLFTAPRGSYTDLVLTFPLLNDAGDLVTSWPLQPSFPLFLRNVLYTYGNVQDAVRGATVKPGEPIALRPEAGVRSLTIFPPGGGSRKLERGSRASFEFADTESVGLYRYQRDDGGLHYFAVNLLDAEESNIAPRQAFQVGDRTVASAAARWQPHEIWKYILVAALIFLLFEWYLYNKRVYV